MAFSCGVISFNWAVSTKVPSLLHHNVFFSSDFRQGWDRPYSPTQLLNREGLNFYLHKPSHSDPTAAPDGCESVMVLLPVANLREAREKAERDNEPLPSREELINAGREAVLRQLESCGASGVREAIVNEFVLDREEWQSRYNVAHGAAFGLSHNILQLACFRPPVTTGIPWLDSPSARGLYFVGASTRPGNGVPLVLMGCKSCHERIVANHGSPSSAPSQRG